MPMLLLQYAACTNQHSFKAAALASAGQHLLQASALYISANTELYISATLAAS
jgi:hypothetical protein